MHDAFVVVVRCFCTKLSRRIISHSLSRAVFSTKITVAFASVWRFMEAEAEQTRLMVELERLKADEIQKNVEEEVRYIFP